MVSERLQGEGQFHTKNYLLEISRFHAKMPLKSAPQKLNILMGKTISKSYTNVAANVLARSRIVTRSKANSFLIKTVLCENTNIPFSKNY